jgi:hypothetical protein
MPLISACAEVHAVHMTAKLPSRSAPHGDRPWDRFLARAPAPSLDRELVAALTGALPIAARGAAMASVLLSDGTGPLHNYRSPLDLGAAVREATRQMNPLPAAPYHGAHRDSKR